MTRNGVAFQRSQPEATPESLYRNLGCNYPKFFKMDILCKTAWIGAEYLIMTENGPIYEGMDKTRIAVVLSTGYGCLEVDKKYQQSISSIPSPALFVYTLNNIMLGEICIRHGFKGEQTCFANEAFNAEELYFWVKDLLENRGMDACLCGWVDAAVNRFEVSMYWIGKNSNGLTFSAEELQRLYHEG